MGLLQPEAGVLFWMTLAFAVVFIVLARYGFPVIVRAIEERKAYIDRSLEEARAAERKLRELDAEGQAVRAAAERERGRILREAAERVLKIVKLKDPLLDIAQRLEEKARSDSYFIDRNLYPNVDFYSGLVYHMLGIPEQLYTPIFAAARIVGWSAHRLEELINVDKIIRPAYMPLAEYREYKNLNDR